MSMEDVEEDLQELLHSRGEDLSKRTLKTFRRSGCQQYRRRNVKKRSAYGMPQ